MASYPGTIATFTTKHDLSDVVDAADPNTIQSELVAVENALGTNVHVSTSPSASGTFITTSTTFASLNARLANIETGIVADAHTQYVHKSGGDTVTQTVAASPAVIVKANASPSANVWQVTDSTGTPKVYVDSSLNLYTGGNAVLTVGNAASSVTTQAAGDAGTVGTSTNYARQDHKHAMPAGDGPTGTATFRTLGTGAQQAAAGNHTHSSLDFTTFTEKSIAIAASTASTSVDLSTGTVFPVNLTASTTLAFTNPPASGKAFSFTIVAIQDATGGRSITWPAATKWPQGQQPPQNTTANSVNIYSLLTWDGGSTYYAFLAGEGMA